MNHKEITLGSGCVSIFTIQQPTRIGIVLRQTCEPSEIGEPHKACSAVPGKTAELKEGDFVIWIENIESGQVLQNVANSAVLNLLGYNVFRSKE